jgi:hypothetical protein
LDVVDHGTRRWSQTGSLYRLFREPQDFSCSRAELPLLTHPWLLTCSRVTCCLARAHAYGIESSQLPVEHSRSHPRTHQFNSTRTSGSCNFAAGLVLRVGPVPRYSCPDRLAAAQLLLPSSPRYNRPSTAFSSTASDVHHARLYCPLCGGPHRAAALHYHHTHAPSCSSIASPELSRLSTVSPLPRPARRHSAQLLLLLLLLLDTCSPRPCRAAGSSTLSSLLAPACELLQLCQLLHTAAGCGLGSPNLHAAAPQHLRRQSLLLALRLLLFQHQSAAHAYASTPALPHLLTRACRSRACSQTCLRSLALPPAGA